MEEVKLPIEFLVKGTARTLRAATVSQWKGRVVTAARDALPEGAMLIEGPLAITIYHFPAAPGSGDVDNIVKPILDALTKVIYFDDEQVERVLVQRFPVGRGIVVENPTAALTEAAETEPPLVFVRVHRDLRPLES